MSFVPSVRKEQTTVVGGYAIHCISSVLAILQPWGVAAILWTRKRGKQAGFPTSARTTWRIHETETGPLPKADRGRDGPKATPPSEPDGRFSRIRLSG